MFNRGVIRNREYSRQVKDFSYLRWESITPTDLDAFMDFNNRLFVFIEVKHENGSMPRGQQLAYERLCKATSRGGIPTFVLLAEHNISPDRDINVGQCRVVKMWTFDFQDWTNVTEIITAQEMVRRLVRHYLR